MVEQCVEMYDLSNKDGQSFAKNIMNNKIGEGWLVKIISITPDYGDYGPVYPQMYVLYERELKQTGETMKNSE